jgi:superfamily I DNA/RNA helicase
VSSHDQIRRFAWAKRRELGFELDQCATAEALIDALESATGVSSFLVPVDDPLLGGAFATLNLQMNAIFQGDNLPGDTQAYNTVHEFGHWFLHREDSECTPADLGADPDGSAALAIAKVDGYSARERRESEANVFAAELLLPLALAKDLIESHKWSASRIAEEIGVPPSVAWRQLADAVLLPIPQESVERRVSPPVPLDDSQRRAATVAKGPLLVSAGPGTGKTNTLVGRCIYLTKSRGVSPKSILALTFSRKAAAEMSERLAAAGVRDDGSGPWVGTFHSFGLEILRKYGDRIGLSAEFALIDDVDGVVLLENHLADLGLKHLKSVRNPAQNLPRILKSIKRAKDKLCPPDRYADLAQAMVDEARTAYAAFVAAAGKKTKTAEAESLDKLTKAEKVVEVARTYAVYERLLRENNLVDYSDLITCSVGLLIQFPDVREYYHRRFPFVLADEYQDVNRASAMLLKLIAGNAQGLWVVGDHRQSIYQFQGASPANVSLFQHEYPGGELHDLQTNYRSVQQIVDTFSSSSRQLSFSKSAPVETRWSAHRGSVPGVEDAATLAVFNTVADQYGFIRDQIEELRSAGIPYSAQAVLLRTHAQAKEAAEMLSSLGIPELYIGPLLERPEIKDLIAVVGSASTGHTAALVRMAVMPEYRLTPSETLQIFAESGQSLEDIGLSPSSVEAAGKLRKHLEFLKPFIERPGELLRAYLFDISKFLEYLSSSTPDGLRGLQSKIAVRQFLDLVEGFDQRVVTPDKEDAPNRCAKMLAYLRRLGKMAGSTQLPEDDAISQIDAVRILTMHSVKGLEYPAVFVPNLNRGQFPTKGRNDGLMDPPGLSDAEDEEADEEECLFFVALSRARDRLFLTRFEQKSNGKTHEESRFVTTLEEAIAAGSLLSVRQVGAELPESDDAEPPRSISPSGRLPIYTATDLEKYQRCPRNYYYEKVLHLDGGSGDVGYLKLHGILGSYADWLEAQMSGGIFPTADERHAKIAELWEQGGPVGHLHESVFREEAETVADVEPVRRVTTAQPLAMSAKLRNAVVQVRPDSVAVTDGMLRITRRMVGEARDGDHTNKRLALLRRAAVDSYPEYKQEVELHYLHDGTVMDVPESTRYEPNRVAKYEAAVDGIEAGQFPAKPENWETCNSCSFFFVCPRKADDSE